MSSSKAPTVSRIAPNHGPLVGGMTVTITGSGFTEPAAVEFGPAGATNIMVLSDSVIAATAPDTGTPGPVHVTVVANGQRSAAVPNDQFTYLAPKVEKVTPNQGSLAGGMQVAITGTNFTGAAAVNFGAAGATEVCVVSDNLITATVPNTGTPGPVDVRVVAQGQASPSCAADQFTYTSGAANGIAILVASKSPSRTFIQFLGGAVSGSYYDSSGSKQQLIANTAYSLDQITSDVAVIPNLPKRTPAVLVQAFSGRLYVSLGEGLTGMSDGYFPAPSSETDANYALRYQYVELTITPSQAEVDLGYIDFVSISLSLCARDAPHATNAVQNSQVSLKLATAAGAAAIKVDANVLPAPIDQLPSSSFARVISPQFSVPGVYHNFAVYLRQLANTTVRLRGVYWGTGSQPASTPATQAQTYDYEATIDGIGNVTLAAKTGSGNGSADVVPVAKRGTGVGSGPDTTVAIKFADLNATTGIYGCNPPYCIGVQAPTSGLTNDLYGQVVGDLLAGFNFGYVGSTQPFNGQAIGTLASTQWWGGTLPDGTVVAASSTPGGTGINFAAAQDDASCYNTYAAMLSSLTTGYAFPLQDRLGRNLLSMSTQTDPDGYLQLTVEP